MSSLIMTARPPWILEASRILTANGELTPGHLVVDNGRIAAMRSGTSPTPTYRFPEGVVVPGFIDLQVNGCAGVDFLTLRRREGLRAAERHLLRSGVTSFLPTLVTASLEQLRRVMTVLAEARREARPHLLGVHLEGPFLNPKYRGAHDPAHLLRPDQEALARLLDGFEGVVRLVTLAPELPGAEPVVRSLVARGIVVAAGHSDADLQTAERAFQWGVSLVTHLFNAMRPFQHRDPGIVGAALLDGKVRASLIMDGVHLHPRAAALALRLLGPDRAVLVTDAIAPAGLPPGRYTHGGHEVLYDGVAARLPSGTLAGSGLSMERAIAAVVAAGWSLRDAVQMASETPASLLGLKAKGVLREGADADLVVLDADLTVRMTVCGGDVGYHRDAEP